MMRCVAGSVPAGCPRGILRLRSKILGVEVAVSLDRGPKVTTLLLEQARNLNYSRAMTALRSPGFASDPPEEMLEKLKQLHPPQSPTMVSTQSSFLMNLEPFKLFQPH